MDPGRFTSGEEMVSMAAGTVRADLLDTAQTAFSDLRTVLISLVLLGAAWLLFRVFWQTKAITACLIALLTGAFVYFGVENVEWLGKQVSDQIRQWSAPATPGVPPSSPPDDSVTVSTSVPDDAIRALAAPDEIAVVPLRVDDATGAGAGGVGELAVSSVSFGRGL